MRAARGVQVGHGASHSNLAQEVEALKRDKAVLMQEVIRLRHQQQVQCAAMQYGVGHGGAEGQLQVLNRAWRR